MCEQNQTACEGGRAAVCSLCPQKMTEMVTVDTVECFTVVYHTKYQNHGITTTT